MHTAAQTDALCALNHFFVVLDSETYRAIEADTFLRHRFAANELRTTVRTDQTYTGLYFYGMNTYFELFDVAKSPAGAIGNYGLAFGVDRIGGIAALRSAAGSYLGPKSDLITRLYEGQQLPWFFMATLPNFPNCVAHSSWVMEYHPEFLDRWNGRADRHGGVRRRDILARYRDVLPERVIDQVLVDVVGLTLAADSQTRQYLESFCAAAGYHVEDCADGSVELHGPDLVLRLVAPDAQPEGIRQVEMRTHTRPVDIAERHFGRSRLHVAQERATLKVDYPPLQRPTSSV